MPRIYISARGEPIDFDAIIIKQKLAQAPMDIEVARRKSFIDSKEEKPARRPLVPVSPEGMVDNDVSVNNDVTRKFVLPTDEEAVASVQQAPTAADFELGDVEKNIPAAEGPIPNLPNRGKK